MVGFCAHFATRWLSRTCTMCSAKAQAFQCPFTRTLCDDIYSSTFFSNNNEAKTNNILAKIKKAIMGVMGIEYVESET